MRKDRCEKARVLLRFDSLPYALTQQTQTQRRDVNRDGHAATPAMHTNSVSKQHVNYFTQAE